MGYERLAARRPKENGSGKRPPDLVTDGFGDLDKSNYILVGAETLWEWFEM